MLSLPVCHIAPTVWKSLLKKTTFHVRYIYRCDTSDVVYNVIFIEIYMVHTDYDIYLMYPYT